MSRPRILFASAAALALFLTACGSDPDDGSDVAIEGVLDFPEQDNGHVEGPVDYDFTPPIGGDHDAVWLNCGVYPIAVPDENAVHSLEHGVVWIAYDPELAQDQVDDLIALYDTRPDRIIVSPYPDLESPITAVAWRRALPVDSADDPRLAEFLDAFVNSSAAPEPRAACTGGLSLDG